MAPVAPSGWPIAIAPPLTLTLCGIEIERLQIAQHDRGERLVDLDQVDVLELHLGPLEHLLGDVDRPGQHQRRLRADIGEGPDVRARLELGGAAGLAVADQHRGGAVDDAGRIAGVVHVIDGLDLRMRLHGDRVEAARSRPSARRTA